MGLGDGSVEVWDYVQSQKRLAWRAHTGPGAKIRGVLECIYVVVTYPSLSSPRPLLPPVSALASNRRRRWQGESLAGKCHGDHQG